jgi:hypothetical protein
VVALGAAFHVAVRPTLLSTYRDAALDLPWHARIALGDVAVPMVLAAAAALAIALAASRQPRGWRLRALGAAVASSGLLLMVAALAAIAPLLQ